MDWGRGGNEMRTGLRRDWDWDWDGVGMGWERDENGLEKGYACGMRGVKMGWGWDGYEMGTGWGRDGAKRMGSIGLLMLVRGALSDPG